MRIVRSARAAAMSDRDSLHHGTCSHELDQLLALTQSVEPEKQFCLMLYFLPLCLLRLETNQLEKNARRTFQHEQRATCLPFIYTRARASSLPELTTTDAKLHKNRVHFGRILASQKWRPRKRSSTPFKVQSGLERVRSRNLTRRSCASVAPTQ